MCITTTREVLLSPFTNPSPVEKKSVREIIDQARKDPKINKYVRRIHPNEWDAILRNIEHYAQKDLSKEELNAIKEGNWDHSLFKTDSYLYLAMYAFFKGEITQNHLNKLFLYDACQREGIVEMTDRGDKVLRCQLFGPQGIDPASLKEFLVFAERQFSEKQLVDIGHALNKLPPEDTQFFIVGINRLELFDSTYGGAGFLLRREGEICLLFVAPPLMVNTILAAAYPESAMITNPFLGFSEIEVLSQLKYRACTLPAPFVSSPEKVHGKTTSPLMTCMHDYYHLNIDSANPHKKIWLELAKALQEFKPAFLQENPGGKAMIDLCHEVLLDRDFPSFTQKENDLDSGETFWETFGIYLFTLLSLGIQNEDIGWIRDFLINGYVANQKKWEEEYGISIQHLDSYLKNIWSFNEDEEFLEWIVYQMIQVKEGINQLLEFQKEEG